MMARADLCLHGEILDQNRHELTGAVVGPAVGVSAGVCLVDEHVPVGKVLGRTCLGKAQHLRAGGTCQRVQKLCRLNDAPPDAPPGRPRRRGRRGRCGASAADRRAAGRAAAADRHLGETAAAQRSAFRQEATRTLSAGCQRVLWWPGKPGNAEAQQRPLLVSGASAAVRPQHGHGVLNER